MGIIQSIFGIQAPKFIEGANTILLDHVVVITDQPEPIFIRHESIMNRHREWVVVGEHWKFEVNLLLYKYGASKQTKYDEIKAYECQIVDKLFRRRDGIEFRNAANNPVTFRLDEVTEFYLDHPDFPDILRLSFTSQDVVAIEKSALAP